MKDALISSTILVLVILLIRGLFRNKLSFRFQYFLWFFVAARLLLFFVTLPQSTISVMNLFQWESGIKNEQVLQNEALSVEVASDTLENSNTDASNSVTNKSNPGQMGSEPTKATFTLWNITKWAKIIWVAGSIILASYFIFYDFHNSFPDESWWDGKNMEWDVYNYGFSDADDTGKITYDQNGYDTWITECYERYGLELRLN